VFWFDVKVKIVLSILCFGLFHKIFILKTENRSYKKKNEKCKQTKPFLCPLGYNLQEVNVSLKHRFPYSLK
jgi:hypothetical protein